MVRKYLYRMYPANYPERVLAETKDGSHTIIISGSGISYHSIHGAIRESLHIFIQMGLSPLLALHDKINVFEMGFGTGLNVLLSLIYSSGKDTVSINYTTVEAYPLDINVIHRLNYPEKLEDPSLRSMFMLIHDCEWEKENSITNHFLLTKHKTDLLDFNTAKRFHLVYFDAFAPDEQPQLWSAAVFKNIFEMMLPGGLLLTYSSKGSIRRAMKEAGFMVEKLPGPPGKKEMVRATKPY